VLDNSIFKNSEGARILLNVIYNITISLIFLMLLISAICLLYREKHKKHLVQEEKRRLLKFIKEENLFVIRCYQYSLNHRNEKRTEDYFPLPIIANTEKSFVKIRASTEAIKKTLQNLFLFYEKHNYKNECNFNIEINNNTFFDIPFHSEVLEQIIISVIYNFFIFNKTNKEKQTISIKLEKNSFQVKSTGIKLTKEIAIKASERVFFDSLNPFILKFSQIFGIFEKHKIDYLVEYDDKGTQISFSFNNVNNNLDIQIVSIDDYKKGG
jgi:cbb3-type cytochrome oxidase subunit 3